MNAKQFANYLTSPAGMLLTQDAAKYLRDADPEIDDLDMVQHVKDMGFPLWAARRIFIQVCNRFPPCICQKCGGRFKLRKKTEVGRACCPRCVNGPKTAEQIRQDKARSITYQAVASGKLKRKSCEVCGAEKAEMHHPDYSRPLFIKWLCFNCHVNEHRRLKKSAA